MKMIKTMRWFGPHDTVSLTELKQAGAEGIVTALHQIPVGEVWTQQAIKERQALLNKYHLPWSVVESLPVHEDIKKGLDSRDQLIDNYIESMKNLSACGVHIIAYNFMPILDWLRTDHMYPNPDGSFALNFQFKAFVYFDIELLKRPNAHKDYDNQLIEEALAYGATLSDEEKKGLFKRVLLGLPGSTVDFTADQVLHLLESYRHVNDDVLFENLQYFLKAITPTAEQVGIQLAIHPDDPPYSLMGLPRIVGTQENLRKIFKAVPSPSNGLCYCTGSLGAHPKNELTAIFDEFKDRIHFLHLRNVKKEPNGDFRESPHLVGDNPMIKIMKQILDFQRSKGIQIPMRPDHGFLHSSEVDAGHYPGYSLLGRMRALGELSGVENVLLNETNN